MLPSMVTTQLAVPVHAPDQPEKTEPALGEAVSVTVKPGPKLASQVLPQLMLPGLLVTRPVPAPALATAKLPDAGKGFVVRNMPRPCVAAYKVWPIQNSWSTLTFAGPSLTGLHVTPASVLA